MNRNRFDLNPDVAVGEMLAVINRQEKALNSVRLIRDLVQKGVDRHASQNTTYKIHGDFLLDDMNDILSGVE